MGFLERINDALDSKFSELTTQYGGYVSSSRAASDLRSPPTGRAPGAPRMLGSDDIEAFMQAAEDRPGPYGGRGRPRAASPTTRARFLHEMRLMNPLRLARIERDIKWLRREALRRGIDPEEVRWMV